MSLIQPHYIELAIKNNSGLFQNNAFDLKYLANN